MESLHLTFHMSSLIRYVAYTEFKGVTHMTLEDQFHNEMVRIYHAATEFGYYPNYFIQMVSERGGLEAAKHLLNSEPSTGFARLWEERRLDLSVEALVLQKPWTSLFTCGELAIAESRLRELGYDFEGTS